VAPAGDRIPKPFTLALVQMYVEPGDLSRNLDHAEQLVADAVARKADVVLLPEAMDLGWAHPSALHRSSTIPDGPACCLLTTLARKHHTYLCSGITEREDDSVYNSSVIINDQGEVLIRHRKVNELGIAHHIYDPGDRLNVCRTPFGTFGLMVCADANADGNVLTRSLCYLGADVILSPASWAVKPDHDNRAEPYGEMWRRSYGGVARDFSVWIAGCSNVGPITEGEWKNWNCIGCSMVIDSAGNQVVQGPYGKNAEAIVLVDINPVKRPASGDGWYHELAKQRSSATPHLLP
jgi:predicted amidohydrolase